jgi:uncharacterized coiled-coil protein SlyX
MKAGFYLLNEKIASNLSSFFRLNFSRKKPTLFFFFFPYYNTRTIMSVQTITTSISPTLSLTLINAHTVFKAKMTEIENICRYYQNDGDSILMSWAQEFLTTINRLNPHSLEEVVRLLQDQLWLFREHVKSPHPPYAIIETPILVCGVLWEKRDFDDYISSYPNINPREKEELLATVRPHPFCQEMIKWYRSLPLEPLNAIVPAREGQLSTNYSLTMILEGNQEYKIQLYHQFAIASLQKQIIARQSVQIRQLAMACTQTAAKAKAEVGAIFLRMEEANVLHRQETKERLDKIEDTQTRTHAIYSATLNDQNERIHHLNSVNQHQEVEIRSLNNRVDSMQQTINSQAAQIQALASQANSGGSGGCALL